MTTVFILITGNGTIIGVFDNKEEAEQLALHVGLTSVNVEEHLVF